MSRGTMAEIEAYRCALRKRFAGYESIVETLEILGDPEMVTALRESLEDLKRGRVVSHAEAKKRLGV